MSPRHILFAVAIGIGAILIFLVVLWSPERQVRLHQENFLAAVSKKDWPRVATFIGDDYSDRWGHDKAIVLGSAKEVFSQFVILKIVMEEPAVNVSGETGTLAARLVVTGRGSPIADAVIERGGNLREPFMFRWQRRSWKPWDWSLIRFDHPQLEIPEGM